ncbi:hypothetical protein HY357_04025 [Candidatus Roizmanbacteria bacterium]|nr:hypothetical protein [Candidatus Roizmanbacteria bacterium]
MKIFFHGAYAGIKHFGHLYKKIHVALKELGLTHVDDESISLTNEEFLQQMRKGRQAYLQHYHKKMKALQEADICVFETSIHSLGIGFLIDKSLTMGKPTVVLYHKDNIPYFLVGIEDDKLIVKSYDEKNLKKVLRDVITKAKEHRDKRFNFFISPRLLNYLEKISKKEGITKSKFIRNLILEHMKKTT